jgi:hypothetical protein
MDKEVLILFLLFRAVAKAFRAEIVYSIAPI